MTAPVGAPVPPQDERAYLEEAAAPFGIDVSRMTISRFEVQAAGTLLSGLRYEHSHEPTATPIVLLHGGGQNAHTWDLMVAALGADAIALDLPGHGASSWLSDHDYSPRNLTAPVVAALRRVCPDTEVVVGMSLGGMVAVAAAGAFQRLRHLVIVDVSPGSVMPPGSQHEALAELGPAPIDDLVASVAGLTDGRRQEGLRHAVWHSTGDVAGGRMWRRDPQMLVGSFADLWPEYEASAPRMTAIVAGRSSYVPSEDLAKIERLLPGSVHHVAGASHSVQNTRPQELAAVLRAVMRM